MRSPSGVRIIAFSVLAEEPGWWFVRDRVVLFVDRTIDEGAQFLFARNLDSDTAAPDADVARDVD